MSATVSYLRGLLSLLNNTIRADEIELIFGCIADLLEQNDTSSVIAPWSGATTYDTPGAGNGNPSYADYTDRIWKSKVDGNLNQHPPADPGTTENSYWVEVSKGSVNTFKECTITNFFKG